MLRYIATRIAMTLPVLAGAALAAFLLIHMVPGDPALALLGTEADDAALATLRHALALDRSLPHQFLAWASRVLTGDFGTSIVTGRPVAPMLVAALGPTAILVAAALSLAVLTGVPVGVFLATHRGSAGAALLSALSLLGLSIPSFWLGLMLIQALAMQMPVFPASGHVSLTANPADHLAHLALPALTLAIGMAASTTRLTHTAMRQALRAPHVRTALAKGLSVRRAVWRHAFPFALATIIVQVAVQTGKLIGGVIVIETVFAWPGLGKMAVDAVFARDYPVVQGVVLLTAALIIAINLLADIAQILQDPRVGRQ